MRMVAAGPIRLVAFDLDGVVWRGERALPGAREALEDVLRRGLDLRYVTNNSTAHREAVSERLRRMGLPSGVERVLTSGFAAARWLQARLSAGSPVMVIGEVGLVRELREVGLDAYEAGEAPPGGPEAAAVVVGLDRSFSYEMLAQAQAAIREGALFVATNRDATFPTPQGLVPGAGAIVAAVETAAETKPVVVGKPSRVLADTLAAVTGVPPSQTLFVGDRLSTDIALGRKTGMVTVLVLTGVTSEDDLRRAQTQAAVAVAQDRQEPAVVPGPAEESLVPGPAAEESPLPDYVLADLRGLPALLDELRGR